MQHKPIQIILAVKVGQDQNGEILNSFFRHTWTKGHLPTSAKFRFRGDDYVFTGGRGITEDNELVAIYVKADTIELSEDDVVTLPPDRGDDTKMLNVLTGELIDAPPIGRA